MRLGLGIGTNIGGIGGEGGFTTNQATLPSANLVARWFPHFSTVAESGGKVTQINDLVASNHATNATADGPTLETDARGTKFLRFDGSAWLEILGLALASRDCTVWLVGRQHRAQGGAAIFSLKGGAVSAAQTILSAQAVSANQAPRVRCHSHAATDPQHVIGSQLQVIGAVSRSTAAGGIRTYHNNTEATSTAQSSSAQTGANCEIGRNAFSPGAAGTWNLFDLYEMVVYSAAQSNADADATAAALVAAWQIPEVTKSLVLEGDSITQGTGTVASGDTLGMLLSNPGGNLAMPAGWRVVNAGVSGNQTSNLVTRRDTANSVHQLLLSGVDNYLVTQIGRNDIGAGALTGAQTYANIVALLNTASTGYLQRGYTRCLQCVNIAVASGLATQNDNLRALLRDINTFRNDTLTNSGQAFEGKLSIVDLPLVTVSGDTIFNSVADSSDTNWYQGDATHPNTAGVVQMATRIREAISGILSNPLDSVPGMQGWIASDTPSIVLSGSDVVSWNDKYGSGDNFAFASLRPTYAATGGPSGGPIITKPTGRNLAMGFAPITGSPYTIYAVVRTPTITTTQAIVFTGTRSGPNGFRYDTALRSFNYIGEGAFFSRTHFDVQRTTWMLLCMMVQDNNSLWIEVNDEPVAYYKQNAAGSTQTTMLDFGSQFNGIEIAELRLVPSILSDSQNALVKQTLVAQYGLTMPTNKVMLFGDSHAFGTQSGTPIVAPFYLNMLTDTPGLSLVRNAANGTCAANNNGIDASNGDFFEISDLYAQSKWSSYKVILCYGTNDCATANATYGWTSWANWKAIYKASIQDFLNVGWDPADICIMTPPYSTNAYVAGNLTTVKDLIKEIATELSLTLIDWWQLCVDNSHDVNLIGGDGIHGNDTTHSYVRTALETFIES